MKYSHQFIIYMASQTDPVPEQNAELLVARAAVEKVLDKTTIIPFNEPLQSSTYTLTEYQARMTGNDRVYVVGHGTDISSSVGGCSAKDWAKTIGTMTNQFKIKRVSFVACHSGGDGSLIAPHRFVVEFFEHAKNFVTEVTGYTGSVHLVQKGYQPSPTMNCPSDAVAYRSWSGEEWWLTKGTGRKAVSHEHDENDNRRKIYVRAGEQGSTQLSSTGWTNKL